MSPHDVGAITVIVVAILGVTGSLFYGLRFWAAEREAMRLLAVTEEQENRRRSELSAREAEEKKHRQAREELLVDALGPFAGVTNEGLVEDIRCVATALLFSHHEIADLNGELGKPARREGYRARARRIRNEQRILHSSGPKISPPS